MSPRGFCSLLNEPTNDSSFEVQNCPISGDTRNPRRNKLEAELQEFATKKSPKYFLNFERKSWWKMIKVEGGELEDRNQQMAKKKNPLATYIFVVILLTVAFALILPTQFKQFIDAIYATFTQLSQLGQVIVVLIIIALVVYLLRRSGKI